MAKNPENYQPTPEEIKSAEKMLLDAQAEASGKREIKTEKNIAEKILRFSPDLKKLSQERARSYKKNNGAKESSPSLSPSIKEQLAAGGINFKERSAQTDKETEDEKNRSGSSTYELAAKVGNLIKTGIEKHDKWAKGLKETTTIKKSAYPAIRRLEELLQNSLEEIKKNEGKNDKKSRERAAHFKERAQFFREELGMAHQYQKEKERKKSGEAGKKQKGDSPRTTIVETRTVPGNDAFDEMLKGFVADQLPPDQMSNLSPERKKPAEKSPLRTAAEIALERVSQIQAERANLDPLTRLELFTKEHPQYAGQIARMKEKVRLLGITDEKSFLESLKQGERLKKVTELSRFVAAANMEKGTGRVESAGGTPQEISGAKMFGEEYVKKVGTAGETAEEAAIALGSPPSPPPGRGFERAVERPSPDCYDFGSCYEKASDAVKRFAKKLYEGVKMKTADRAKIWHSQKLYDWHDRKSRKFVGEISASDRQISTLETQIKRQEERLSGRFAGASTASRERIAASVRKMRLRLEKLRADKDKKQSWLNNSENHKRRYENKRIDIAAETLGRIADGLRPYEQKIASLKNCKNQYDLEINSHSARKKGFQNELEILRREMAEVSKEEKGAVKEEMAVIKAELKRTDRYLKGLVKERQRVEKQLTKWDKSASYWRDAHNVFSRIANRETVYFEKETRKIEVKPELGRKEISAVGGETPPAERQEIAKIRPLSERINEWNNHFGSKFHVRLSDLERNRIVSGEKNVSSDDFEAILNDYYVFRAGSADKRKIPSDREFEEMVAMMKGWKMSREN